jgi:glycosyltransferase involved in cell wall biosynthesis
MKIAYVYDAVYPWETGGVQKRVWELARRLAKNHEVHWFGLHYWDGPATIAREGVNLHGVGAPTNLYVDDRRSIPEAMRFSAQVTPRLLRQEFDLIDCQEFPYFPAFPSKLHALTRRSTLLITWHEVWNTYWYEYLGWKGVFGKAVERLTATLPDTHIAVSERTAHELSALNGDTPTLVPNGISLKEIKAAPVTDREVDVLFVGRLIPEKNPELVIKAVARLREDTPDIQCVVVGEGPRRAAVEDAITIHSLESNVTILPFQDEYREILGLMKGATVFALPSQREGFGMTVLEALACGTPVVTIDHPRNAARELINSGATGVVCVPNSEELARGIRTARGLSEQACIDAARKYEWSAIVERIESTYSEAIQ